MVASCIRRQLMSLYIRGLTEVTWGMWCPHTAKLILIKYLLSMR
jgi:hypothetical protein